LPRPDRKRHLVQLGPVHHHVTPGSDRDIATLSRRSIIGWVAVVPLVRSLPTHHGSREDIAINMDPNAERNARPEGA